jgi:hypothetical protein
VAAAAEGAAVVSFDFRLLAHGAIIVGIALWAVDGTRISVGGARAPILVVGVLGLDLLIAFIVLG